MGASVVARCDASPVSELGEQVFDFVARPIERLVIGERNLSAFGRWNAGLGSPLLQRVAKPVAVVAPVGDQGFRLWQDAEHESRVLVVAHLAFGKQHDQRLTGTVTDDVHLGVQPAAIKSVQKESGNLFNYLLATADEKRSTTTTLASNYWGVIVVCLPPPPSRRLRRQPQRALCT